jgi:hypothetical protein
VGREEEAMPGLAGESEVPAGVVVDGHGEVAPAVVVLLDGHHRGRSSGEGEVEDVGSPLRMEPDPRPSSDVLVPDAQRARPAVGDLR